MPTVFITVDTALHRIANINPASHVLVHAAAGGVGLAAMQVITAAGATALTTAGSPSKRALLRQLGSRHVSSSRDTLFVEEMALTGGATAALNTLTSTGMVAGSLAALAPGGIFIEISKRDIWSAARVAQGESSAPCPLRSCTTAALVCWPADTAPALPFLQNAPTWPTRCLLLTSCLLLPCTTP